MKKLNLNSTVKVKLTDYGKDIYYHQYDELNEQIKQLGRKPIKPHFPEVDKNGYTQFQLWYFMQLYGTHMQLGVCDNGIDGLNIYIDEKDLVEVE